MLFDYMFRQNSGCEAPIPPSSGGDFQLEEPEVTTLDTPRNFDGDLQLGEVEDALLEMHREKVCLYLSICQCSHDYSQDLPALVASLINRII